MNETPLARTLRTLGAFSLALGLCVGSSQLIFSGLAHATSPEPESEADLVSNAGGGQAQPHGPEINLWTCHSETGNPPLMFVLLNFAILLFALVRLTRRPLASFLAERHDHMRSDIDEAAQLRRSAQQRLDEIEAKLGDLDAELAAIRQAAVDQAEQEKLRIIAQAEADVQQIMSGADRTMRQELEQAKRRLEITAVAAGVEAGRQLLRSSIDEADRVRLHDEYVRQITSSGGRA